MKIIITIVIDIIVEDAGMNYVIEWGNSFHTDMSTLTMIGAYMQLHCMGLTPFKHCPMKILTTI